MDTASIWSESDVLENDWDSPMRNNAILDEKNARHRRRLRDAGDREVLFQIPAKTLAAIDEMKERQRLRNRSLALLQLIERGMQATE